MSAGYLNFDLVIERLASGFRARVVAGPAGQAAVTFEAPFSDLELENFRLRIGRARAPVRLLRSTEVDAAKAMGERLFASVFTGELDDCLKASLAEAARQGAGLRLRLSGGTELADLPWEYLYSRGLDRFISLSSKTPIVRYVQPAHHMAPLTVERPLRILAIAANPAGHMPIDAEREWANLRKALGDLESTGLLALQRARAGTLTALQDCLRRDAIHIIHFIGHGAYDERTGEGMLAFEEGDGRARLASGQELGTFLHDHDSLRLVVLNACEGARMSRADPTTGAAQALVRQQIPAVIAMQFEISDEAAASFAHGFYRAIAEALPVDAALAEARKAMFADGHLVEWGTPVLYTLSPDGHLFDVLPPAAPRPPPAPARESDYGAGPPAGNAASMAPPAPSGAPASPPMAAIAPAPLPSPPVPTPEQPSAGQRVSRAILPTVLLAATFLANLLETAMEQWWAKAAASASVVNASAFHRLEREFVFDAHDVTNAIALYGYSSAYFFAFPLLGVLLAVALARRPGREPYLTFSLALTVAYVISLPFFLLFPVPERWAYPESGAILLSDRWSTALIEVFRPMSGLDNCFPSFHVTMSVVMIAVCHLYGVRFRTVVSAFCLLVGLSTFVLGIHWLADIGAGVALGVISVGIARRLARSRIERDEGGRQAAMPAVMSM